MDVVGWLFHLKIPGVEPDTRHWPAACVVGLADEAAARDRVEVEAPGEMIVKAIGLDGAGLLRHGVVQGQFKRVQN